MEFTAFQATRKRVDDIQAAIGFDDDMGKRGGFVYGETCYIEECADKSKCAYYLLIGRSDWVSNNLERLEKILWAEHYLFECASPDFKLSGWNVDLFIQAICDSRNIALDGDVFGIMFSGADEFTANEALALINKGADVYGLRFDHVITLPDMTAWEAFAEANAEALADAHESQEEALQLAKDGRLTLGGGAHPRTLIRFEI